MMGVRGIGNIHNMYLSTILEFMWIEWLLEEGDWSSEELFMGFKGWHFHTYPWTFKEGEELEINLSHQHPVI